MIDAFGQPQSVVVLGGTSDIALAFLRRLEPERLRSVVIAARQPDRIGIEGEINTPPHVRFASVRFDARDADGAGSVVARCFEEAAEPVDLVVLAIGQGTHAEFAGGKVRLERGRIVIDRETGQTSNPKYFAGGDCTNGGREVVDAVADGKRAGIAMAQAFEQPAQTSSQELAHV